LGDFLGVESRDADVSRGSDGRRPRF